MSERNGELGAFFLGVLFGGLAGAITALLFAPQSGEETRTIIHDKAIELRDKASETMQETISKAESTANEAVKQAENTLKVAKSKAEGIAQKGHVILEEKLGTKKPKEDKTA